MAPGGTRSATGGSWNFNGEAACYGFCVLHGRLTLVARAISHSQWAIHGTKAMVTLVLAGGEVRYFDTREPNA